MDCDAANRKNENEVATAIGLLITAITLLHAKPAEAAQEKACVPPSQAPQAPIYPEAEKKMRVGGTTMSMLTMDECGVVTDVSIVADEEFLRIRSDETMTETRVPSSLVRFNLCVWRLSLRPVLAGSRQSRCDPKQSVALARN